MTRHDVAALKGKLDVLADAYADAARSGGVEKHPWYGIGNPELDYFGREALVEHAKQVRDALLRLGVVHNSIVAKVNSPIHDTIADISSVSEALARLPKPAAGADFELYAALADPRTFESFEAFEREQAAWLDAERRLAESTNDTRALANNRDQLQSVSSLADEVGFDNKTLSELDGESATLAEKASLVERTILFGQRLAEAFQIETPMTAGILRRLLAASRHAASLPHDLMPLRHPGLADLSGESVLAKANIQAQKLQSKVAPIAERLSFELKGNADEWRSYAEVLQSARFPSIIWRRDVREAKRRYKRLMRVPGNRKRLAIAAGFEVLAECIETAESFATDARLQTICGQHFRGHDTPFSQLSSVSSYVLATKGTFSADDEIEKRLEHMLLEGEPAALARIALLGEDVEAAVAAKMLENFKNDKADLVERHLALTRRANKVAELGRRALALGLRPDVKTCTLSSVAKAVEARIEAEAAINANQKVQKSPRPPVAQSGEQSNADL